MPGRYEDPSVSGTFQRKVVTFLDQDDEDPTEHVVELHDNQESFPLIQVHQAPVATSAPKPTKSTPKPADRPYIQMRPKLPPKKKPTPPPALPSKSPTPK